MDTKIKPNCKMKVGSYTQNLRALIDLGEFNYRRLLALFPCFRDVDRHAMGGDSNVVFTVVGREKYTTSLEIRLNMDVAGAVLLLVRLYHDAEVAEVISPSGIMSGAYEYPNPNMYQVDEKAQSNYFLGECLTQCELVLTPKQSGSLGGWPLKAFCLFFGFSLVSLVYSVNNFS